MLLTIVLVVLVWSMFVGMWVFLAPMDASYERFRSRLVAMVFGPIFTLIIMGSFFLCLTITPFIWLFNGKVSNNVLDRLFDYIELVGKRLFRWLDKPKDVKDEE